MQNIRGKFTYLIRKKASEQDALRNNPLIIARAGFLGDNSGNITKYNGVDLASGKVVFRDPDGNLQVVYNQRVPLVANLPVLVGYDPLNPTLLQVLGSRDAFAAGSAAMALAHHHKSHELSGADQVWVSGQQITPGLVFPSSGMVVSFFEWDMKMSDASWKHIPAQDINLTSHKPGTGGRWVTISFSQTDGSLNVSDGAVVTLDNFSTANIGAAPDGYTAVASVALFAGMSTITVDHIRDLRWSMSAAGAGGFGNMLKSTYDKNNDGVIDGDALPLSEATPQLGGAGFAGSSEEISRSDHSHPTVTADGDMLKSVYDVGDTGIVDNSHSTEALQGTAIDPAIAPATDDLLRWDGAKWVSSAGIVSILEDCSSQVDGITAHFTTVNNFIGGTVDVFDDGVAQNKPDITEDGGLNGFTLSYVPAVGHPIFVRYTVSVGPTVTVSAELVSAADEIYKSLTFV